MSRSLVRGPATHAAAPRCCQSKKPLRRGGTRGGGVLKRTNMKSSPILSILHQGISISAMFFKTTKALFPPRNDDRFNLPRIHLEEDVDYTAEPASVAQIDYFFFSEITDSAAMHNTHPLISIYMRTPACTWCKKTKIKNPLNKAVQLRAEMIRQNMEAADLP